MTVDTKQKTFNDIKNEYDDLFENDLVRDEDRAYAFHAKHVLKHMPNNGQLLDIACGAGYFLRELRKQSEDVNMTGTDISSSALSLAEKECPSAKYLLSVAESMPFQDKLFDAITCLGSLEHFLDIPKAIQEMCRISKDGASFYIMVPNEFWYKDLWAVLWTGHKKHRNQTQERFSCLGEWQETFEENGLKIKEVIKYNGIAKRPLKQWFKDLLIPLKFSYHFIFVCEKR